MKMKSKNPVSLQLLQGNDLTLDDDIGCVVCCQAGCLWITEENLGWDFFLHPGHSFTVDRPGKTLVTALVDSTCNISGHEASTPKHLFFAIEPIKHFFAPH